MKQVVIEQFGGVEQLKVVEVPTPEPGPGQVRVRLTSIGMNHADLMARRGEYRLSSGDPPFVPGLEAGGVIEAVGPGVTDRQPGQRVILGADVPRLGNPRGMGGTYRSHYLCDAAGAVPAPPSIPEAQLGTLWLPYLTAWGCLAWKQQLRPGQVAAFPAASSSVALAGAQVARRLGATTIGLTTSPEKVARIRALPGCAFDHLVTTVDGQGNPAPWHKDLKKISERGIDVFFDPVAAGAYLETEIRCLAQHGTVWIYGLLAPAGKVDVTPLIRKHAAVRGWALAELIAAGTPVVQQGYRWILEGFEQGHFRQHLDQVFRLEDVQAAHTRMEQGGHVGKLALVP